MTIVVRMTVFAQQVPNGPGVNDLQARWQVRTNKDIKRQSQAKLFLAIDVYTQSRIVRCRRSS